MIMLPLVSYDIEPSNGGLRKNEDSGISSMLLLEKQVTGLLRIHDVDGS